MVQPVYKRVVETSKNVQAKEMEMAVDNYPEEMKASNDITHTATMLLSTKKTRHKLPIPNQNSSNHQNQV